MALLLGVTRDTYTKYEGREASLMPHNLIVPFCLACRVSVEWLLTGIGPTRAHTITLVFRRCSIVPKVLTWKSEHLRVYEHLQACPTEIDFLPCD